MSTSHAMLTAIVEDHPLFRDTLGAVVSTMDGLELGSVSATAQEALDSFAIEEPDLVLIDYSLEGLSAPELVSVVKQRWPEVRCLVLSGHRRADYADAVLDAGASGYILKGRPDELEEAIEEIRQGRRYVSPAVSGS